jgi:hypothetical protein
MGNVAPRILNKMITHFEDTVCTGSRTVEDVCISPAAT